MIGLIFLAHMLRAQYRFAFNAVEPLWPCVYSWTSQQFAIAECSTSDYGNNQLSIVTSYGGKLVSMSWRPLRIPVLP